MGREMGRVSQYGTGVVQWILQEVDGRTPISRENGEARMHQVRG